MGSDSPADADNWSRPGRGTTGKSNKRPTFVNTASLVTLRVNENTRSGQHVGGAVEATDTDRNNRLTYSLEGPGKPTRSPSSPPPARYGRGPHSTTSRDSRYSLTVKVNDGQRRDNSVAVKSVAIIVDDVDERPSAPVCTAGDGNSRFHGQRPSHVGRAHEPGASHHRLRRAVPGHAPVDQCPTTARTGA